MVARNEALKLKEIKTTKLTNEENMVNYKRSVKNQADALMGLFYQTILCLIVKNPSTYM